MRQVEQMKANYQHQMGEAGYALECALHTVSVFVDDAEDMQDEYIQMVTHREEEVTHSI